MLGLSSHAEVNALKMLPQKHCHSNGKGRRRGNVIVYVARFIVRNGELELAESKPCRHCLLVLHKHGIRKVMGAA